MDLGGGKVDFLKNQGDSVEELNSGSAVFSHKEIDFILFTTSANTFSESLLSIFVCVGVAGNKKNPKTHKARESYV